MKTPDTGELAQINWRLVTREDPCIISREEDVGNTAGKRGLNACDEREAGI